MLKASDEFEYYGMAQASQKIWGFTFVTYWTKRAVGVWIICALFVNALKTFALIKKKNPKFIFSCSWCSPLFQFFCFAVITERALYIWESFNI
jgi:hypothetical protein